VGTDLLFRCRNLKHGVAISGHTGDMVLCDGDGYGGLAAESIPATLLTLFFLSDPALHEGSIMMLSTTALRDCVNLTSSHCFLQDWFGWYS